MKINRFIPPLLISLLLVAAFSIIGIAISSQSEKKASSVAITEEQQTFIDEIASEAKKLQQQTHLFASITIAQAILESDWGRSDLALEANNLFGIKGSHNDQSSVMPTDEYINGQRITVDDAFKKYETIQASLADHLAFLEGASYQPIKTSKNYREAARALQNGGYATDPDYATKLIALIEEFDLSKYDK